MASSFQVQAPEFFNFSTPAEWTRWKKKFERFSLISGLSKKDDTEQIEMLMYLMGDKADDVFLCLKFETDDDKKKIKKVLESFDSYFQVRKNVIYERARFHSRNQEEGESMDEFITSLFHLAQTCDFGTFHDEMIRDRIVVGVRELVLSEKLQMDEKLTLDKAMKTVRQYEMIKKQQIEIRPGSPKLNQMKAGWKKKANSNKSETKDKCGQCGKIHFKGRPCPALNSTCNKCGVKGHWESCCPDKAAGAQSKGGGKNVSELAATENEVVAEKQCYPDAFLLNVATATDADYWTETIKLEDHALKIKLDTGADVTAIPYYFYKKKLPTKKLYEPDRKLRGSSGAELECVGMFTAKLKFQTHEHTEQVYVIRRMSEPLLSGRACEKLRLVARLNKVDSASSFTSVKPKEEFPELFDGLGKIGSPYNIKIRNDAQPYAIHTPRRVPIPLMEKLKARLNELEKMGIIRPIEEATEWCAPTVIASKSNGDIRLCVDLSKLNEGVEREIHPMPVVEHMLGQLGGAKYFSKLDANSGFHQIPLDPECQKLTTFITPFGRYCFTRMPFGISLAPEVFQRTISIILQGEKGVIVYMDDILIFASTQAEHDNILRSVLKKLKSANVTLNESKCMFGVKEVHFLGHVVNENGLRPDPKKVDAVVQMPAPTDVSGVRRFLGMLNHLGKFVSNLAETAAPLNELLVKENEFHWGVPQENAFAKLKTILVSHPVLALYDITKETLIASDASSYGIGAVLKQKHYNGVWRPVAYASRTMTDAEKRYAQIEKEALAMTWACERFQDFLIGRDFKVETDHKPLIPLFSTKELATLTPRLQRFRMRMMRFSYSIKHVPGKDLIEADALSRQPLLSMEGAENEEETAAHINAVLSCLPLTDERLAEIAVGQDQDPSLQRIIQYIENTWPEKKKLTSEELSYFHVRDELSVANRLLLRGCRLVIPASMRNDILEKLHAGHFGITKTRLRARDSVWWPGISEQIEATVKKCSICIQEGGAIKHETMIASDFPTRPWQKLGMDLFKHDGKWYLVVIDYYSRYPEIVQLERLTAEVVIGSCKSIFARHGIPDVVMSDNGTQFGDPIRHCHPGAAREFARFATEYGFTHVTSSPKYPQSNGMAEAGVKIAKKILKKASDPSIGLLEYRTTPLENGYSPAELLMGRKLRSIVPVMPQSLSPQLVDPAEVQKKEGKRKEKMKENYDKSHAAKDQEELQTGDGVWIVDLRTWGKVLKKASTPRSYVVETPHGSVRRNRFHLRKGDSAARSSVKSGFDLPECDSEEDLEDDAAVIEPVPEPQPNDGQRRTTRGRAIKPNSLYPSRDYELS